MAWLVRNIRALDLQKLVNDADYINASKLITNAWKQATEHFPNREVSLGRGPRVNGFLDMLLRVLR